MLGFRRKLVDDVHMLEGSFDENGSFEDLLLSNGPLKMNLRGIKMVNSLGLRKLVAFARALGERVVEFHECTPPFIEAVNTVPLVVGGVAYIDRIKSVAVPFCCEGEHRALAVLPIAKIKISPSRVELPTYRCKSCGLPMEPESDIDVDDLFFFLKARPPPIP